MGKPGGASSQPENRNSLINRQSRAGVFGPLFLGGLVGEIGLAQIELTLDPPPRFVVEFAVAEHRIDGVTLGFDQQQFDLIVQVRDLAMLRIAIILMNDVLEPVAMMDVQRFEFVFGEAAFR